MERQAQEEVCQSSYYGCSSSRAEPYSGRYVHNQLQAFEEQQIHSRFLHNVPVQQVFIASL